MRGHVSEPRRDDEKASQNHVDGVVEPGDHYVEALADGADPEEDGEGPEEAGAFVADRGDSEDVDLDYHAEGDEVGGVAGEDVVAAAAEGERGEDILDLREEITKTGE